MYIALLYKSHCFIMLFFILAFLHVQLSYQSVSPEYIDCSHYAAEESLELDIPVHNTSDLSFYWCAALVCGHVDNNPSRLSEQHKRYQRLFPFPFDCPCSVTMKGYCMNDGACLHTFFRSDIQTMSCRCGPDWTGKRCSYRFDLERYQAVITRAERLHVEQHISQLQVFGLVLLALLLLATVAACSYGIYVKCFFRRIRSDAGSDTNLFLSHNDFGSTNGVDNSAINWDAFERFSSIFSIPIGEHSKKPAIGVAPVDVNLSNLASIRAHRQHSSSFLWPLEPRRRSNEATLDPPTPPPHRSTIWETAENDEDTFTATASKSAFV